MKAKRDSERNKVSGMSEPSANNADFLETGEWEVPENIGKKRRESVGALIRSSPLQAVSVIRGWLNKDQG